MTRVRNIAALACLLASAAPFFAIRDSWAAQSMLRLSGYVAAASGIHIGSHVGNAMSATSAPRSDEVARFSSPSNDGTRLLVSVALPSVATDSYRVIIQDRRGRSVGGPLGAPLALSSLDSGEKILRVRPPARGRTFRDGTAVIQFTAL